MADQPLKSGVCTNNGLQRRRKVALEYLFGGVSDLGLDFSDISMEGNVFEHETTPLLNRDRVSGHTSNLANGKLQITSYRTTSLKPVPAYLR